MTPESDSSNPVTDELGSLDPKHSGLDGVEGIAMEDTPELPDDSTLFVESGVVEQLLGLATGSEDARPQPSEHALELLLAPAVHWAIEAVVDHGRDCDRPAACPHVPPPLRRFLKMRRPVLEKNRVLVAQTLLQHPHHAMTSWVRERWSEVEESRDDHSTFVDAIKSGAIFTTDGLDDLLGTEPQRRAQRLGTLLWARGLESPRERAFFDLLRLVAHEPPEPPGLAASPPAAEPTRGQRRRERRDLETKIGKLESEIADVRRDRRRQAEALRRSDDALAQLREQLEAAEADRERIREEIATVSSQLHTRRAELQLAHQELSRTGEAAAAARKLAEEARSEREEIEQARSLAVRELAVRRREIEVLRGQLRAIPTGKHAVHAFLQEEEQRIDTDLSILQGGDRERARQEHALREKLEDAFKAAYPEFVPPRPVLRAEPAALRLTPLGGADEVGRSAYFLQIGDYSILVDCGIKIGGRDLDEITPDIDRIDHVDAVILTHAHTDHLGWLPALARRFPDVDIYCTPETAELAPIMLDDCQRHHFAMMHRLRERAAYSSNAPEIIDPYDPEDVLTVQDLLVALDYGEVENLPSSDLRLTFFRAGHVLGAASALIEGDGRRVLIGGDISNEAQLTVGPADWSGVGDVDLLVLESTYGDKKRPPLVQQQRDLIEFASQTLERDGSVILPCFGLGRGQEVTLLLAEAMERGDIKRVSVWIDGMIRRINRVYERHCAGFSLPRENFWEVEAVHDRFYVIEEARRQPTIIVTTSGMLAGGPAIEYARALLSDSRNRIAFTGYQDEGNPGYALVNLTRQGSGSRQVQVMNEEGEPIEIVAAAPAELFQLSAHADQSGLTTSAAAVRPRHIVLVHGDRGKQELLGAQLGVELANATVEYGSLRTFTIA